MTHYSYRQGTSRGVATYGYNIVTLTNCETGKRYSTNGGGYDMLGSVLGEIISMEHSEKLNALHKKAEATFTKGDKGYKSRRKEGAATCNRKRHFYGLTAYYDEKKNLERVLLDGATGVSNVKSIAEAIGLKVTEIYDRSSKRNWKLIAVTIEPTK